MGFRTKITEKTFANYDVGENQARIVARDVALQYCGAFPEIKDLNGQKQSISGGNKPILVHFWGTWCPFCLRELPSFTNFAATYRDKFTIMLVAIDDKDEAVINFINDNQLPLPVLRASYKGSVPVTFLLDKSGQPRFRFDGAKPWNAPHAQAAMEELFHSLQ